MGLDSGYKIFGWGRVGKGRDGGNTWGWKARLFPLRSYFKVSLLLIGILTQEDEMVGWCCLKSWVRII